MTVILGAGLSGLIGATQFPKATVLEANSAESLSHKAVLRFRSDSLSRLTGIPFQPVTVHKSIWFDDQHQRPSIQAANLYSMKTNGKYLDRSIWNLDPVERFIAPESLQEEMIAQIGNRIKWNHRVTSDELTQLPRPVISTLPMPTLLKILGIEGVDDSRFMHKSIVVDRYRVHGADVFQTIYYPDPRFSTYRVSITGNLMIRERTGIVNDYELRDICESFGLNSNDLELIDESHEQRFGKIAPIDARTRKQIIFELTQRYGIYSMGRFATWRNILLDDTIKDGAIIKRLITHGVYSAAIHSASISTNH